LELLSVVVIITILAILLLPVISTVRSRAQRVSCTANLHSLYVAANLYVIQNASWPQITMSADSDTAQQIFAQAWINVLRPFGPTSKTWICSTMQDLMQNPDYTKPENARIDYTPMPFDDKPTTSHRWPRQPWFVENGDMHGNGNLVVFTDGSISDLKTIVSTVSPAPTRETSR
jgi:type II secretory pathway pseudopilin PulG